MAILNGVIYLTSRSTRSLFHFWSKSSLVNTLATFKLPIISTITRLVQYSMLCGAFSFAAATIQDTQGVGPLRYSITSSSTPRHNCSSRCLRTWNGTLRSGYVAYIISEPWDSSYTYGVHAFAALIDPL